MRASAATVLAATLLAGCGTSGSAGPQGSDRPAATVPNVVGRQIAAANQALGRAGFSVRATIVRGRRPRNAIVTQDPRAGTRSRRGLTVQVTVSDGVAG